LSIEQQRDAIRKRVLGFSLECPRIDPKDHGRDLVLERSPDGSLDFAKVEKIDCLSQSLKIALTTALGSDIFNTEFGFDGLRALAEETSPVLVRERARVSVIQVLRRDARVRQIVDVEVSDQKAVRDKSTGFGRLTVSVGFETVTDDRVDVNLGRVDERA
jgi:phage baseplate assembly protein W